MKIIWPLITLSLRYFNFKFVQLKVESKLAKYLHSCLVTYFERIKKNLPLKMVHFTKISITDLWMPVSYFVSCLNWRIHSWQKSFAVFGDQIKDASRTRRGCLILWPYICKSGQSCCIIDKMRPFSSQQRYVLDLCCCAIMESLSNLLLCDDTKKVMAPTYLLLSPIRKMGIKMGWFSLGNGVCFILKKAPSDSPIWLLKKRELLLPVSFLS